MILTEKPVAKSLANQVCLRSANFSFNHIADAGISKFANAFAKLPHLLLLDVRNNQNLTLKTQRKCARVQDAERTKQLGVLREHVYTSVSPNSNSTTAIGSVSDGFDSLCGFPMGKGEDAPVAIAPLQPRRFLFDDEEKRIEESAPDLSERMSGEKGRFLLSDP